ncbi:hypothetical protein DFH06DRAFT_1326824 [Mycena polygramma]|nr:hypothetical protein DFH06DRAFT_1326824 [Mycena polygramma]
MTLSRPLERSSLASPSTIVVHDHMQIQISDGFEIKGFTTGVETAWVVVTNLPARIAPRRISCLLASFGSVLDMKLFSSASNRHLTTTFTTVYARFNNQGEALRACSALNSAQHFKRRLCAEIPVNSRCGLGVATTAYFLQVRWESPRTVAYVGYPTIGKAQKAINLAKTEAYKGYHVEASIHVGLPGMGEYTVKFQYLPPQTDNDMMCLHGFACSDDIMWERSKYLPLAPAVCAIRETLCREVGNFKKFEVLPRPYSHGIICALASFTSPAAATLAAEALNGRRISTVADTPIVAHPVQTLTYHLSFEEYKRIEPHIDSLRETAFPSDGMAVVVVPQVNSILIRLSAEKTTDLAWLKYELENTTLGQTLQYHGVAVCNNYFAGADGALRLKSVERMAPGVQLEIEQSTGISRAFGPPVIRAAVLETLMQKILNSQFVTGQSIVVPNTSIDGRPSLSPDHKADPSVIAPPSPQCVECPICCIQVLDPVTATCGHSFCRDCVSRYLLAALEERTLPLTCPGARCTEPMSLKMARSILECTKFNSLLRAAMLSYTYAHREELRSCPSTDCKQFYRVGLDCHTVQCPSCLLRICTTCHTEAHDSDPVNVQGGVDRRDRLFQEWVESSSDAKNCPRCKIPVERDGGCYHITCLCGTHICWKCLGTFPADEIYDHILQTHGVS